MINGTIKFIILLVFTATILPNIYAIDKRSEEFLNQPGLENLKEKVLGKDQSRSTTTDNQIATNETTGWQIFTDSENGYKIQYPQDWKIAKPMFPSLTLKQSFAITADDDPAAKLLDTLVNVYLTEASRTLDPGTLKMQSIPLYEYANQQIAEVTSPKGEPNVLKNEAVSLNGQPAWRLDYINNYLGTQLSYESHMFLTNGNKVYDISLWLNPLKVEEEMRSVGEEIMQTFQLTNNNTNKMD